MSPKTNGDARPSASYAAAERRPPAARTASGLRPSAASARTTAAAPRSLDASRVDHMLDGVRAAGLKLTPQRIAIVRAIAGDPSHPTAQEIFDRLQSSMPTMSFATVYNTLDALAHAGLCGSLSLSPGPARFDPNMEPHHHAVCDGCGLVRDVERSPTEARESTWADKHLRPEDKHPRANDKHSPRESHKHPPLPSTEPSALDGFEVRAVEHIYRGLCADCASGRRSSPEAGNR